jgi:hypothetical protein
MLDRLFEFRETALIRSGGLKPSRSLRDDERYLPRLCNRRPLRIPIDASVDYRISSKSTMNEILNRIACEVSSFPVPRDRSPETFHRRSQLSFPLPLQLSIPRVEIFLSEIPTMHDKLRFYFAKNHRKLYCLFDFMQMTRFIGGHPADRLYAIGR